MTLNVCSEIDNTSALMLLAKVSHMAKRDVSGVRESINLLQTLRTGQVGGEVQKERSQGSGPEADD